MMNQQQNNMNNNLNNDMESIRQNNMRNMQNMQQNGLNQNPYINNQNNNMLANDTAIVNGTQNPYYNNQNLAQPQQNVSTSNSLLDSFDTENFIKGALIGAVGAYLVTNETAQKAIFKGVAKTTSMFQAGMEEMKERYEDAQAELEAESES